MKVRLTRKLSEQINGIDLSNAKTGETLDLPNRDAQILMAEGWAEYEGTAPSPDKAHERTRRKRTPRTPKTR